MQSLRSFTYSTIASHVRASQLTSLSSILHHIPSYILLPCAKSLNKVTKEPLFLVHHIKIGKQVNLAPFMMNQMKTPSKLTSPLLYAVLMSRILQRFSCWSYWRNVHQNEKNCQIEERQLLVRDESLLGINKSQRRPIQTYTPRLTQTFLHLHQIPQTISVNFLKKAWQFSVALVLASIR